MAHQYFIPTAIAITLVIISNLAQAMEGDLFLTPMIKSGDIAKAKAAATDNLKLAHIKTASNEQVVSYSGFITIDEAFNSNIFFVYFPAMENPDSAPLILHGNEFYGVSVMRNIFAESGPFIVGPNLTLVDNPYAWNRKHAVLYIDAPVGTGFSFTDNKKGEAKNDDDDATEVLACLTQLMTLFPELKSRDMYLAADTYGSVLVADLAVKMEGHADFKGRVKGLMFGSPMFDATYQLDVAENGLALGLIDEEQSEAIRKNEDQIRELVKQKKYDESSKLHFNTRVGDGSLYRVYTGFDSFRHAAFSYDPPSYSRYGDFVNTKELHSYLHVGLHKFVPTDFQVIYNVHGAWFQNNVKRFEHLLAAGTYKVVAYSSQFDLAVPHPGVTKMINGLQWSGTGDFKKSKRTVWKMKDGEVGGYVKSGGGLTYVMLRNSGGLATIAKPDSVYRLLRHLVAGEAL